MADVEKPYLRVLANAPDEVRGCSVAMSLMKATKAYTWPDAVRYLAGVTDPMDSKHRRSIEQALDILLTERMYCDLRDVAELDPSSSPLYAIRMHYPRKDATTSAAITMSWCSECGEWMVLPRSKEVTKCRMKLGCTGLLVKAVQAAQSADPEGEYVDGGRPVETWTVREFVEQEILDPDVAVSFSEETAPVG